MTQEDKDLLLKYLCMALPYGVKVRNVKNEFDIYDFNHNVKEIKTLIEEYNIKPYLRPMSSMTMEDLQNLSNEIGLGVAFDDEKYELWLRGHTTILDNSLAIDWLLKNHFDFIGLISKGLAIEVTKENNPYKD